MNLTGVAAAAKTSLDTITNYLDVETDILSWPRVPAYTRTRAEQLVLADSGDDKLIIKNGEDVIGSYSPNFESLSY